MSIARATGKTPKSTRAIFIVLVLSLLLQPVPAAAAIAEERALRGAKKHSAIIENSRAAQALTRLTFGPRPGDVERVKAMGAEKFINQQLDPDSIDDISLAARLGK
jgi:hypothetical protein